MGMRPCGLVCGCPAKYRKKASCSGVKFEKSGSPDGSLGFGGGGAKAFGLFASRFLGNFSSIELGSKSDPTEVNSYKFKCIKYPHQYLLFLAEMQTYVRWC